MSTPAPLQSCIFFGLALGVSTLLGCTTPQPIESQPKADRVDDLIAKYAASATSSLRTLSESEGRSKAVTASLALTQDEAVVVTNHGIGKASTGKLLPTPVSVIEQTSRSTGALLSTTPDGLSKLLTVRWTGDIEDLLARICSEVGWLKGSSSGLRVSPVIISIEAVNAPAYEILRDVGAISGGAADVVVSASAKTISLRYPTR